MLLKEIKRSETILGNKLFIEKANPNKIKLEREKYQKYLNKYQKLNKNNTK
ncbi:hypothetical protein [Candidatus Phytoplasma ziziphi]|nr:hypothetical protein [Candidatus Phytoplasma ziziphi]